MSDKVLTSRVSRADAYDRYIDEITRKENIEAIKEANKENIKLARKIKRVIGKKTQHIINKIKSAQTLAELDEILADISWSALPQLVNAAVDIERKAHGINNEMLSVIVEGDSIGDIELNINIKKKALLERLTAIETEIETNDQKECPADD